MVDPESSRLFKELRGAGLSRAAIEAAWPSWWNDEIAASASGRAELRFTLARKLGLVPKSLLGERVEFVWKDRARFKNLTTQSAVQQSILGSFGVSVGRLLLRATEPGIGLGRVSAERLRQAILGSAMFVDLRQLIATCWGLGVPVIQLRVLPLSTKSMHAMVVESSGRFAILLARDAQYPAPIAFALAHEMGHIALDHLDGVAAIVDMEDPALTTGQDVQELEANAYALEVLTGSSDPKIETGVERFNAPTLARAVLAASSEHRIEPGTLALCVAYRQKVWPVAMSALHFIYSDSKPVWKDVNAIAAEEINWSNLTDEATSFLRNLMALNDV